MPRFVVLLLAAVVAAPACAQAVDPALTSARWSVVEIAGAPAAHGETLQFAGAKVSGRGACNRFTGSARQAGPTLEIGELASTRMFCQGKMDAEQRYFEALRVVRSYTLTAGILSLAAADGRTVVVLGR